MDLYENNYVLGGEGCQTRNAFENSTCRLSGCFENDLWIFCTCIDRFHSRDQNLDNCCYAAILVYQTVNKPASRLRSNNGIVLDCWMCKQKWSR